MRQDLTVGARVVIRLLILMIDGGTSRAKISHRVEGMVGRNARHENVEAKKEMRWLVNYWRESTAKINCEDNAGSKNGRRGHYLTHCPLYLYAAEMSLQQTYPIS